MSDKRIANPVLAINSCESENLNNGPVTREIPIVGRYITYQTWPWPRSLHVIIGTSEQPFLAIVLLIPTSITIKP